MFIRLKAGPHDMLETLHPCIVSAYLDVTCKPILIILCIYLGVMAAKNATLTFMVGGPEAKFPEAKELLSLMGKNVVHCGGVSSGQVCVIS